jgi:hypothetical protein
MKATKKSVSFDGEIMWNILYHEDGELVARSALYGTEQEVDTFIASLSDTEEVK